MYGKINEDGERISPRTGLPIKNYKKPVDETKRRKTALQNLQKAHDRTINHAVNAESLAFLAEVAQLKIGVNKRDVDDMRRRFYQYVQLAAERGMKIGNLAAYEAMGTSKQEIYAWSKGEAGREKQQLALEVKAFCGMYREFMAQEGQIRDAVAIFYARNFDGMTNADPVQGQDDGRVVDEPRAAEIAQKYRDLPED